MKTVIILPDVHLEDGQPHDSYDCVKKFISQNKIDECVLLGDFMNVSALSHWDKDKTRKMEGKRWKDEVAVANKELDFLQKHIKKIYYIEGNHEAWVEQYIDYNPEMEGLIEIPEVLHLKKRGIDWLGELKLGKMTFIHGDYVNKYHAQKHLQKYGCNLCYGHSHRPQFDMLNMIMQKPHMAYGLGCLCSHEPDYANGRQAWLDQFAIMNYREDGEFNLYPVNIIDHKFIWNNKEYK